MTTASVPWTRRLDGRVRTLTSRRWFGSAATDGPSQFDVVLAVGLAVFAQLDLRYNIDSSTHYGSDLLAAAMAALATLPLVWRRQWPFAVLCVVLAATAGPELVSTLTFTLWGDFVPILVALYSVARWADRRPAVVGLVLTLAAVAVIMLRVPAVGTAGNIPFSLVPVALVFGVGRSLQRRTQRHLALEERTEQLERLDAEREARLAAAIEEERQHIARELHDVVAHCVSVMVVQAGAAEDLLDRAPERARESLHAVQDAGHQAVAELGRMLGLLRGDGPGDVSRTPQPGLAQLPDLAQRVTALGVPVRLIVDGDQRPLPPGIDLTAYRIVQEALTNTVKHAGPGATARVEVRFGPRGLEIGAVDDGAGPAATGGCGQGLVGMTERTALYGGTIEVGGRQPRGFRVHVRLPLAEA